MSIQLNYYILLEEGKYAELEPVEPKTTIAGILERIYTKHQILFSRNMIDPADLKLYKLKNMKAEEAENSPESLKEIIQGLQPLKLASRVQRVFGGENELDDSLAHLAVAWKPASHKRQRSESQDDDIQSRHEKHMKFGSAATTPSNAARPNEMRWQQQKYPIYNGRPDDLRGPPIAIYHEAFAQLKDDLAHPDTMQVTPDDLKVTHQLFHASSQFYDLERERIQATKQFWEWLLGFTIRPLELENGSARIGSCATVDVGLGKRTPVLIKEWKVELGTGGDAEYQGACAYRKFVCQEEQSKFRARTCCPCLIIGIIGPYFCIMGAAFVDIVIAEPLTEWIFLGGKPERRITEIARIFKATAAALHRLEGYYKSVTLSDINDSQAWLPHPAVVDQSSQPPSLRYIDRLCRNDTKRSLYHAKMGNRDVVVKFTDRYCKEAHELLAREDLAPKLHFIGRIKGGLDMVVMDYIKDVARNNRNDETFPPGAYADVQRAIELLHGNDLVFGDLRRPNIIVVDREEQVGTPASGIVQMQTSSRMETNNKHKGAVLIDFDWCGKAREARYPDTLNDIGEINWAPGVERCGLMKKEHDTYQLKYLNTYVD